LISHHHPALQSRTAPASSGPALRSISADGGSGVAHILSPDGVATKSISADGRYVLISSLDGNFAENDTNGFPDIFVRDLATGMILPASIDDDGSFSTNQTVVEAAISASGRYVVFGRQVPPSYNPSIVGEDLFRCDLQ